MADLVNASAQAIADALAPSPQAPAARWRWGSVVSVNADGTMNVSIGGATVPSIRCAQHVMGAQVGDRVRVLYCGTECMVDAVRATGAWTPWEPSVLYDSGTGTTGSVTLSESAAGFSHMRIYFMQNDGYCSSADVYEPDGKAAVLVAAYPGATTYVHWKAVGINGTTISVLSYARTNLNASSMTNTNTVNQISIYRVEAW